MKTKMKGKMKPTRAMAASITAALILAGTAIAQNPRVEPETIILTVMAGAAGFIAGHIIALPYGKDQP